MDQKAITLDEFTIRQWRQCPQATGELSALLRDIGLAAKRVHIGVNKAGLTTILGDAGGDNIQGERVQKLDLFAHCQFTAALQQGVCCAGIASEEAVDFIAFDDELSNYAKYVCLFDPLDGSSNIDVNVSIGTIFSIYRRVTPKGTAICTEDFLQQGRRQVAAGYIIYGPSTMLVYATPEGVNGFTLDPSLGEFCLSHPDMKIPEEGKIYAVNHSCFYQYKAGVKRYIAACQRRAIDNGGPYTERYTGSMVADMHRSLIKGGIFMYPATIDKPRGKLRLLYECNPFAFIIETAGGKAVNGQQAILDVQPLTLHERTPFYAGSKEMVKELEHFLQQ